MTTTNYAIVTVLNKPEDRGWGSRHYTIVRDYEYLEDAKQHMKFDAVSVYQDAEFEMNRWHPEEQKRTDYHLEIVKLSWSGNHASAVKTYTKWPN